MDEELLFVGILYSILSSSVKTYIFGANKFAELDRTYLVVKSSFDISFFRSLRAVSIAFSVLFDTSSLADTIASDDDTGKDQDSHWVLHWDNRVANLATSDGVM